MKESPFITILTAALNNGATIGKTLVSVKNQTFQDIEHVVIDGGSQDETLDILREFNGTYNLTWISKPDHGIADALNRGLSLARGRYILVIHADDHLLFSNTLKNVYPSLKKERFDIVSFPVFKIHSAGKKVELKPIRILGWHRFKTIFPHQGSFVHKRLYDRVGGYREEFSIALDYDFFYRALQNNARVRFAKEPVAIMGGQGISSDPGLLIKRLQEEFRVQKFNEKNLFWQIAQIVFRTVYFPFKTKLIPLLTSSSVKGYSR